MAVIGQSHLLWRSRVFFYYFFFIFIYFLFIYLFFFGWWLGDIFPSDLFSIMNTYFHINSRS